MVWLTLDTATTNYTICPPFYLLQEMPLWSKALDVVSNSTTSRPRVILIGSDRCSISRRRNAGILSSAPAPCTRQPPGPRKTPFSTTSRTYAESSSLHRACERCSPGLFFTLIGPRYMHVHKHQLHYSSAVCLHFMPPHTCTHFLSLFLRS